MADDRLIFPYRTQTWYADGLQYRLDGPAFVDVVGT